MDTIEIIKRITYYRNEKGISARELSLNLGKSENYINKLENMDFTLSVPMLLKILDLLNVNAEEFFANDYKNYYKMQEFNNLLKELVEDIPKEKIDKFVNIIKSKKN